ncbi:hypothetical protein FTW19_10240 [Terriglobus albidus]|uniref:Uncharacterized protein n=1 Tax=Terriglobus albidus TaxID=1592106 RepID=A0A5B9E9M6_9BACT|nr:hypothetical protein [Terriglobus albidus]QEE28344.1 hypothetical protein FTW19_10240 [Terriglobus albidus]
MTQEFVSTPARRRLTAVRSLRQLEPFHRANAIDDISLYWLPVSEFPIKFRQREWVLKFITRLDEELKQEKQTSENFLLLKYTRTDLNERFVNTMFDYRPMTGMLLAPNQQLPAVPTSMEIKKLTENHSSDGLLNLDHLVPEYCAWFAGEQQPQQRQDFFGAGGMLMLWIDAGQEPAGPKIELPRVLATHPAMKGTDFAAMIRKGARLQHPFLAKSREIFAAHLPDGPAKKHSMFVLPRFNSSHFLDASPDDRQRWFEIFSAYCIESEQDRGILLAFRDPNFDERMVALLEEIKKDGDEYPL